MSDVKKRTHDLSVKETAEKLRALADGLERGCVSINEEDIPITLDTKIKISLKSKDNSISIKLKCKPTNTSMHTEEIPLRNEETDTHAKKHELHVGESKPTRGNTLEEYSVLKKRMAKDFGAIMKCCIKEQSLPEPDLVNRFYQDSRAMCNYPEKGEEFYETFLTQAESLKESFNKSDLKAMGLAITALGRIKKECHERYK